MNGLGLLVNVISHLMNLNIIRYIFNYYLLTLVSDTCTGITNKDLPELRCATTVVNKYVLYQMEMMLGGRVS